MSQTASNTKTARSHVASSARVAHSRPSRLRQSATLIIVSIAISLVCFVGYYMSTSVEGIEIHSADWSIRKFSFRRDPFTNYQYTDIYYKPVHGSSLWTDAATDDHSRLDSAISSRLPKSGTNLAARWDLVTLADGAPSSGAAVVLYELLQTYTPSYDLHWPKWSKDNKVKAKALWPAVQTMTLLSIYTDIPKLLDITREELSDDAFESRLVDELQLAILRYCEETDDRERAHQAALAGLKYGDNPRLSEYLSTAAP